MLRIAIGIVTLALAACATTQPSPSELQTRGRATFGGQPFNLFWIPAHNAFADAGRITFLSTNLRGGQRELVDLLRTAQEKPVLLLMSGANSTVAKLEFLAALNDSGGKVPYLTVSFVGDPADAAVVKTAAENAGGKYVAAK